MDPLSTTFQALADPTRRAILARLALGEHSVTELAEPFDISLPGISKHLKVLERSGLISRRKDAQFRPCHLEVDALDDALDWIGAQRRVWSERFDRLDALLADIQGAPGTRNAKATAAAPAKKRPRRTSRD